MAKLSINELKYEIAEILSEAKKKKEKKTDAKKKRGAVGAYGFYDEALDFSAPLGAYNLYRQQGAVNWGPMTSDGPHIDSSFANPNVAGNPGRVHESSDEHALRSLVREVIQFGLIPEDSAWAPLMENKDDGRTYGSIWEAAAHWFQKEGFQEAATCGPTGKGFEKSKFKLDKKAQERAAPKKK
jgi:hypothetical protein